MVATVAGRVEVSFLRVSTEFVKDVDTASFQQEVLQRSREVPVVADFWAEWCQPCHILTPALEKVTGEAAGAFELVKIDVDANQELSQQYAVQGIPTVIAFRDGEEVARFTGALPESAISDWVTSFMPDEHDLMVDQARTARLDGDDSTAEHLFRQVLEARSDHGEAGTSLAALLIDRGDTDEALVILGRLVPDTEVERLQAAARVKAAAGGDIKALEARVDADPDDGRARIELARALAAHSEYEPALDHLLAVVKDKGEHAEEARVAVLDIFELLGSEHPLTTAYRRQLANALY
jgi:putative thioredoxin